MFENAIQIITIYVFMNIFYLCSSELCLFLAVVVVLSLELLEVVELLLLLLLVLLLVAGTHPVGGGGRRGGGVPEDSSLGGAAAHLHRVPTLYVAGAPDLGILAHGQPVGVNTAAETWK